MPSALCIIKIVLSQAITRTYAGHSPRVWVATVALIRILVSDKGHYPNQLFDCFCCGLIDHWGLLLLRREPSTDGI